MSKSQTISCYCLQSWLRWKPGDELCWGTLNPASCVLTSRCSSVCSGHSINWVVCFLKCSSHKITSVLHALLGNSSISQNLCNCWSKLSLLWMKKLWNTVGYGTIEITTTASTFKSVFILSGMNKLFRMYKFRPFYVLWRRRSGRDWRSTSSQRQPQRSCQKYSVRVTNRTVGSDDETKLPWQSTVRCWVRLRRPGGLKLRGGEPSRVCCSLKPGLDGAWLG